MQGFLWTPWNATSHITTQGALWQHILDRNTSSQPFMTPCARQVMNKIPGDVTPSWAGCWGPPYSCSVSGAIYLPAQRNRQPARPIPQGPDRGPHHTQPRRPRVPRDIAPHYGIIDTLKISAVSSGATWTLSLWNFLWTCITQVQSTFATDIPSQMAKILDIPWGTDPGPQKVRRPVWGQYVPSCKIPRWSVPSSLRYL